MGEGIKNIDFLIVQEVIEYEGEVPIRSLNKNLYHSSPTSSGCQQFLGCLALQISSQFLLSSLHSAYTPPASHAFLLKRTVVIRFGTCLNLV